MSTNAYLLGLVGASLVAVSAIAGCDAGDQPEPYAEDRTEQADESTYGAGDARDPGATGQREPGSMDPSAASQRPGAGGMQESPDTRTGMTGQPGMPEEPSEAQVVGRTVMSQQGEEIGTVVEVVEDKNREGKFAVIDVGEFLGIGQKQVALEMRHLSIGADGQVTSSVTADTLESMPEYDASQYGGQETQGEQEPPQE